jgi:hypothetical protein
MSIGKVRPGHREAAGGPAALPPRPLGPTPGAGTGTPTGTPNPDADPGDAGRGPPGARATSRSGDRSRVRAPGRVREKTLPRPGEWSARRGGPPSAVSAPRGPGRAVLGPQTGPRAPAGARTRVGPSRPDPMVAELRDEGRVAARGDAGAEAGGVFEVPPGEGTPGPR